VLNGQTPFVLGSGQDSSSEQTRNERERRKILEAPRSHEVTLIPSNTGIYIYTLTINGKLYTYDNISVQGLNTHIANSPKFTREAVVAVSIGEHLLQGLQENQKSLNLQPSPSSSQSHH